MSLTAIAVRNMLVECVHGLLRKHYQDEDVSAQPKYAHDGVTYQPRYELGPFVKQFMWRL